MPGTQYDHDARNGAGFHMNFDPTGFFLENISVSTQVLAFTHFDPNRTAAAGARNQTSAFIFSSNIALQRKDVADAPWKLSA